MLFADEIILANKIRVGLNATLELKRQILESHYFKLSTSKTKYKECKLVNDGYETIALWHWI